MMESSPRLPFVFIRKPLYEFDDVVDTEFKVIAVHGRDGIVVQEEPRKVVFGIVVTLAATVQQIKEAHPDAWVKCPGSLGTQWVPITDVK